MEYSKIIQHEKEPFDNEPYIEVYKLYCMYGLYTVISRIWEFAVVLLIAAITNNNLAIIGYCGFLGSFSVCVMIPLTSKYIDNNMNRLQLIEWILILKLISVTICYVIICFINYLPHFLSKNLIFVVPIFYSIITLTFTLFTVAIEKDWVVVLSNNNTNWLTNVHSNMSQIDLVCAIIAPIITGFLFNYAEILFFIIFLLIMMNFIATILLYIFLSNLYYSYPNLSIKSITQSHNSENIFNSILLSIYESFNNFYLSTCFGIMLSYSFLYLTVLSFSSLMIVYLKSVGVSDNWIGISRGLSNLTGFLGAWLYPFFVKRYGIYLTGWISLFYQTIFVIIAATSFNLTSNEMININVLIISTLLSRVGLWAFDLSVRQLTQESIPESLRYQINSIWRSIISFFDMLSYFLAILFPNPEDFWILSSISCIMVTFALIGYSFSKPRKLNHFYVSISDNVEVSITTSAE